MQSTPKVHNFWSALQLTFFILLNYSEAGVVATVK